MSRGNAALVQMPTEVLGERQLSVHARRPFFDKRDGCSYVLVLQGRDDKGKPVYQKLRTNATALLQYDEWKDIDRVVLAAAAQRLVGIQDLRAAGLQHGLGSIGQTISQWDRASHITEADVSMSAATQGEKDTVAYRPQFVPVPIVHKDFQLELRRLVASRQFGESLDTTMAELAGRRVAEKSEQILFLGESTINLQDPTLGTGIVYGYTTHPDRNRVNMTVPWDELDGSAGENAQIIEDVQAMQQASRNARYYGPWVLYIPSHYEAKMDEDYRGPTSSDTRTVKERIMALTGISDVRVADFMTGDNVVLVAMQKEVVDLAVAQDVSTVQWTVTGGMVEEYKVMAVWVPRLKSDFDGRSGITHLFPEAS